MNKLPKIAFYCIGNFSEFLYVATRNFKFCESIFYLQNFKGLDYFKSLNESNLLYRYQYKGFNQYFGGCKTDNEINYNIIARADKSHYNKFSKRYTEKIIDTFAYIYRSWLEKDKPEFIFFPIIESLDAMCLYEVARSMGIKTIIYSHFRILPYSFLSDNKYEEIPDLSEAELKRILSHMKTERVMDAVVKLSTSNKPGADMLMQTIQNIRNRVIDKPLFFPKYKNPVVRLIKNIKYKLTLEKHNKILNNLVKMQVFLEDILVPMQRTLFKLQERMYLNRYIAGSDIRAYNFFALHFSPESSINTPAPYYVDQLRVVDKILLESNKPLIVREHPALYGKRSFSFYKSLFTRQRVYYSPSSENIYDIINCANTVYTVTGTVALEAFFKDKNYKQLGRNFFSSFANVAERYQVTDDLRKKQLLVSLIFEIGRQYIILPHSRKREDLNVALFSNVNIESFADSLKTHINRFSQQNN